MDVNIGAYKGIKNVLCVEVGSVLVTPQQAVV